MTTACALSEEFEDGVRMAAVQLSPLPSIATRPAIPGQLRGPLLCALRGARHFVRVARQLDDVPGPLRIGNADGKIGYRRNPGQRGGGHVDSTTQTIPTLGSFITMLTQLWRGVVELGEQGTVHALLDLEASPPSSQHTVVPTFSPYTVRLQFEQQLEALAGARRTHSAALDVWMEEAFLAASENAQGHMPAESLQIKYELMEMYGWTPGATLKKSKTYAGVLDAAGRKGVDTKELHFEAEILKKRCLAETAPFPLLLLARYLPTHGARLRCASSATAMAHQLLGVPPEKEAVSSSCTVEMWLANRQTGQRMPPHLLAQPMAWGGHGGISAETCSTNDSRMHGEMVDISDVNFRVIQGASPETDALLPPAQVGFPVHLGDVAVENVQLQYTVNGGQVQTLDISPNWAALTGNVTVENLSAATGGNLVAIQHALQMIAKWTPRAGGDLWVDVEPALKALCQAPLEAPPKDPESVIVTHVRRQQQAQRQKLLGDLMRTLTPPPSPIPPLNNDRLHPSLSRHHSLGVSIDGDSAGGSIGWQQHAASSF